MKICLIIPCFNEAQRLELSAFEKCLREIPDVFFCFVNDGSTDETLQILQNWASKFSKVTVLDLKKNGGKAEAVRQGFLKMKESDYTHLGYWDADLATPLEELPAFFRTLTETNADLIMGSRFLRLGADIKRTWYRHLLGRAFATVASFVLGLPTYDTQCGAKIFSAVFYKNIFNEPFVSHWIFDVELLMRIKQTKHFQQNPQCLFELPLLHWHDRSGSKLKLKDFLKAPFELFQILQTYGWRKSHGS